jgi:hypothetical protein
MPQKNNKKSNKKQNQQKQNKNNSQKKQTKSNKQKNVKGGFHGELSEMTTYPAGAVQNSEFVCNYSGVYGGANNKMNKLNKKSNKKNKGQRAGGLVSDFVDSVKNKFVKKGPLEAVNQYENKLQELEQQLQNTKLKQEENQEAMTDISGLVKQNQSEMDQLSESNSESQDLMQQLEKQKDKVEASVNNVEQAIEQSNAALNQQLTPAQIKQNIEQSQEQQKQEVQQNAGGKKQKREVRNQKWIDEVKNVMKKNNVSYNKALKIASANRKHM